MSRARSWIRPPSGGWSPVRWTISLALTGALFILYYGYILLIAIDRRCCHGASATATTLGIPLGAAVIVGAWMLTAVYVVWANRHYDAEAERLRDAAPERAAEADACRPRSARPTLSASSFFLVDRRADAGRHLLGGAADAIDARVLRRRADRSVRSRTASRSPATT